MTRNRPRNSAARMLMAITPALVLGGAVTMLVAGPRATEAVAGESPAGSPVAVVPVDCLTDDLTGTLVEDGGVAGGVEAAADRDGVRAALLRLTNTSGVTCQVQGWPDVALVTPPGEVVEVPTEMTRPGTGEVVVLEPGASAWSSLEWDSCRPGQGGCGAGVALQFIVDPDSAGSVAEPAEDMAGSSDIVMKALRVGPVQATREAAVN